ncbi:MAG TPA: hypothetical protein VIV59_10525 [Anaeromyxobacteraceae bacterium]
MRALAIALAALAAPPAPAPGPKVSLNGINIDGATNQRFENCTVTIDASGNVNIEAKGYTVRPASGAAAPALKAVPLAPAPAPPPAAGPAAPAAPEKLVRRYFLVTEQTRPDGTQFDIAVFINAKWIRELKSQEDQVVVEVTRYLRPGPNKVTLAATKRPGERRSTSPDVIYRVVIGEGDQGGDHVRIDSPLVDARRTAAEARDVTEEFTLVAR